MSDDFDDNDDFEEEDDDNGHGGGRGRSRSSRPKPRRTLGRRPRLCQFCADRTKSIDYKQVDVLRRMLTDNAKLRNRRQTGVCAKHQRMVAQAVKRARVMALLGYEGDVRR
ncbi:MAG: 30S ribosomal protein S18 [Anaerolineales bacterium]